MSQINVDNIRNRLGGAIGAPSGIVVTGVSTFSGDVSIGGTLTYEDVTNIDSVGVITARSDVSIADKIIHTSNTGTAIRFPANDTFTVETAGGERLRVNSAGNVGIATASPDNQLHVFGATASAIKIETGDGGFNPIVIQENPDRTWHTGLRGDASDSWVVRDATASANRLVIDTSGAINATGNFTTGGSIISEANPEASDTTNGAMLDKVKVIVRNAAGQSVWLGYKNGTSGATSSINVDGDTTIRDLTVRTVTSSDQIISNRSGTSVCFRAQSGGTDNFVVRADGVVGIGTVTPGNALHVFKNGDGQTPVYFETSNATGQLRFYNDSVGWSLDSKGDLRFVSGRTGSGTPARLKIETNGASTFRADSYGLGFRSIAGSSSVTTGFFVAHSSTNMSTGTITYENYTNGNVKNTNNSYGALSDERLKENIVDAASQWDDIKSLQIRKYNFRESTGYETHTQIGLVAQEVETVCPGLVQETPVREGSPVLDADGNDLDTTKSIATSVLYMKAVKALQEAMTRIETLETKVTALEG